MKLNPYLQRIQFTFDTFSELKTLQGLQRAHLLNVPFENLDIFRQVPILLDVDRIYQKVVLQHRGGFCYELNGLFYELLAGLNFQVRRISARVYHNEEYAPEYDHLAIIVTIDNTEYLADVGFGEFAFAPLRLDITEPQYDERGTFRLDRYNEVYYRVSRQENNHWQPVYIFENKPRAYAEFENMCRFHQTSPETPFTQQRMITLPTEEGRVTLTDETLKISRHDETKEKPVKNSKEFDKLLWDYFGI